LWNAERNHGSITAAILHDKDTSLPIVELAHSPAAVLFIKDAKKGALYSFRDGMQTLSDALYKQLEYNPNVHIHVNTTCTEISMGDSDHTVCLLFNVKD
jgi:protoporphyrinogen oxidase